jgi:Tol biopolymer transport system component
VLASGTMLGPYRIDSPLGAGGMGEVYRARDVKLGRDVAVKILPDTFSAEPDRLARFRREAQVLASLNHPNIGHIYGFEDSPSTGSGQAAVAALVMELVEGEDLAARIARGPIPIAEAMPIAKQIADALEAAHERGIVHRDLKPANIKLRRDGTVKVLDFGLAKALDPVGHPFSGPGADGVAVNTMNSPTITAPTNLGIILGTAAYMAPEQAKGKAVDKRADIWAFGVVLYEMVSGRRGYDAEDVSDTLAAVLTREVDFNALPADLPPRLRTLIRDCLVRDPKQRLRDIGDARLILDRLIAGTPDVDAPAASTNVAVPPVAAWRRGLPWSVAAVAIAAAGAFAWMAFNRPAAAPRPVTRSEYRTKDLAGFVALSRDGTKLAFTSVVGGNSVVLRPMDQFEGKRLTGSEGAEFPVFSPDGAWIAYTARTSPPTIKKIPVAGGTPITVGRGSFGGGGAWDSLGNDDIIVYGSSQGLMRLSADGGTPQPLTTVDEAKEASHTRPQFLPGGKQLLFTVTPKNGDRPQFAVLDLASGRHQTLVNGGFNGRYVLTGHLTFVRGSTLFAVPFDLQRLAVTGAEVPVIDGVSTIGPAGTGDYAVSDTGVLVYSEATTANGTIFAWSDRKGALRALPNQVSRLRGTGRLSPDGRRIADAITTDKDSDIWVMDVARGTPTRLTFGGNNDFPAWAPDGSRVFYGGANDGKFGVYSVAVDGSSKPDLVIETAVRPRPLSLTPDGRTLLYSQPGPDRVTRVMVLSLAAEGAARPPHPLRETAASDREAELSPDGKWVAFTSVETGTSEIYVMPFPGPGAKVRVSTASGATPRWTRGGRELLYWLGGAGTLSLISVSVAAGPTFAPGPPQELFQLNLGTTWDPAPDGERFLVEVLSTEQTGSVIATVTNWFDELRVRAPAKK